MSNDRSRERNRRNQKNARHSQTRKRVTAQRQSEGLRKVKSRNNTKPVYNAHRNEYNYENSQNKNKYYSAGTQIGSRRKNEREKAKRNSSSVMVKAGVFIFVIVLAYLALYTFRVMSTTAISYATVEIGSIETPYNVSGLIIRNEKMFKAASAGTVEYECSDNEKVKAGQVVCSVTDIENVQNMEAELDQINEELFDVQNYRDELSAYYEDFKKYNSAIAAAVDSSASAFSVNDVSELSKLEGKVSDLWDKRNVLILSDSSGSAQELAGQKKAKENEISGFITTVSSDEGGIVSYYADGLEEKYNLSLLEGETAVAEEETKSTEEIKNLVKSVAETDSPVFKIVYNNEWYIASYIETDYAASWQEGDYVTIYITGNSQMAKAEKAYIYKINMGDKKSYVVFKMNKNMTEYITDRIVSIKVSKAEEGYKILNTAITEQNLLEIPSEYIADDGETSNVVVVNGSSVNTISVNVSARDEESGMSYVQIEYGKLNVGSVLQSRNGSGQTFTISNIKTEKGIFITNSGITKFKKINMDGAVTNDTHTILDSSINSNIEVYDRYASVASTVSDDEKTVKQKL